jgi:hypothetical protein
MTTRPEPLKLEDARILFRNFQGKEGPYNKEGDRSFAVEIPDERVDELLAAGWNVKLPKAKDLDEGEEDSRTPFLKVNATGTAHLELRS